jgi:hypothetical protein
MEPAPWFCGVDRPGEVAQETRRGGTAAICRHAENRKGTTIMFAEFECRCVYVEVSSDKHPRSGRVEYRAKCCAVCHARDALKRLDRKAPIAFHAEAGKHARTH